MRNLLLLVLVLCLAGSASAAVVMQHVGSNDPAGAEGWTPNGWGTGGSASGGTDTEDYWQIIGNDGGANRYLTSITAADTTSAQGWKVEMRLKVNASGNPWDTAFSVGDASSRYFSMLIGTTGMGYGGASWSYNEVVAMDTTDGYHDYAMIYDPGTDLAGFYVDDVLYGTRDGATAPIVISNRIDFGDGEGGWSGASDTQYSYVAFSDVPEPATLCLLGLGGLLLRRKR